MTGHTCHLPTVQDGGVYRKVPVQVLDQQSCTRLGYGSDLLCVRRQNSPSAQCAVSWLVFIHHYVSRVTEMLLLLLIDYSHQCKTNEIRKS